MLTKPLTFCRTWHPFSDQGVPVIMRLKFLHCKDRAPQPRKATPKILGLDAKDFHHD